MSNRLIADRHECAAEVPGRWPHLAVGPLADCASMHSSTPWTRTLPPSLIFPQGRHLRGAQPVWRAVKPIAMRPILTCVCNCNIILELLIRPESDPRAGTGDPRLRFDALRAGLATAKHHKGR